MLEAPSQGTVYGIVQQEFVQHLGELAVTICFQSITFPAKLGHTTGTLGPKIH